MSNTAARLLLCVALCCALDSAAMAGEADDQFAVGAGHYSAQRWDLAVEEFRAFVRQYPEHAKRGKAMFFEGEALVQLGRHAEAYPRFVDLLAEQPAGPYAKQSLFRACEAAVMACKTDEAQVRLAQFQSQYPSDKLNASILMYRGQLALRAGDAERAERWYRESLAQYGDLPVADECRINLAHVLHMQKRFDDEEKTLREAAGRDHSPWTEMALLRLAAKELADNKPQSALENYEAIQKRFPNSPLLPQTHLGCGRALYQLGMYAQAENVLKPLATQRDLGNDARYWIAQIQKAQKEFKAAADTLSPTLESVQVKSSRQTAAAAPRREPATLSAKTSSRPASDNPAVDSTIIEPSSPTEAAEPNAGSEVSATVAAQREEQNRRRSATIRYQAADAMIRAGDYGRAISTLQIGDNGGDDPRSLANRYLLAVALQSTGRNEEALQTLEQLNAKLQARLTVVTAGEPSDEASPSRSDLGALRSLAGNVQLAIATSLVAREEFAQAIKPLQLYLATPRKDVGGERARSALAICLAHNHRADEARRVLDDLKLHHPESSLIAITTHHVAEAAYAGGQYNIASELFAALAVDGNPPETVAKGLAGLGWCHYQAGENDDAEKAFAHFLDRFPTDPRAPDVAMARGQSLERAGKDDAALAVVRQALKRYPQAKQLPQLLLAAARLCDRMQQDDEAVVLYQRIARDFPNHADVDAALYGWAWALRDMGRGNDADKVFRKLYDEQPNSRFSADAAYRLAERASQRGERDAAMRLIEPLLAGECPPAVRQHALYLQAQLAIGEEKWAAAESPLERLLREFPDSQLRLPAEFWLAEVAYRRGDFAYAQQRFDALAPRITDHNESWTAIVPLRTAQLLTQHKHWTKARALAESIARDYPQFDQQFEADYVIGRCLAAEANFEGARAAYQRAVRSTTGAKTETAAMAQWMIGESYFHQENYSAALREYLRVEIVYPYSRWQAAALLQAAKCYEQLQQPKEAADLYARLLQSYPQTEFVAEASKRLTETTRK